MEEIRKITESFASLADEAAQLTFLPRGSSHQRELVGQLSALRDEMGVTKAAVVELGDEDNANLLLCLEVASQSLESELSMWLALKEEDYDEAWEHLVMAQVSAASATRAHPMGASFERRAARLLAIEETVFPPQVFMSPTIVFRTSVCSICERDYEECEHIEGRPYMGVFCRRGLKDIEFRDVSWVENPADKRRRQWFLSDGATMRHWMTLYEVSWPPYARG